MKRIKPGRGTPVIGVIFPLFGVIFIVRSVVQAVYHFKNAAGKNRFSAFDATNENKEPAPGSSFCPYCGAPADPDFAYCRKCGRALPKE